MDLQPADRSAWGIGGYTACDTTRRVDRALVPMDEDILQKLERRLGRLHARQRIGIEDDHEARVFGQGLNFFHPENWRRSPTIIRTALQLTGLYWRARKNAENVQIRHNYIRLPRLPSSFDGLTLLHLSDLHVDISGGAMQRLIELLPSLAYDLCVLTGDYRGKTFGPYRRDNRGHGACVRAYRRPDLWRVGQPRFDPHGSRPGGDGDPHAAQRGRDARARRSADPSGRYRRRPLLPGGQYREGGLAPSRRRNFRSCCRIRPKSIARAAHADFDLLLSGHTHGGQICLPGAIPITLDFGAAPADGLRVLEIPRHGRLHLGRGRIVHRRRKAQLSSGDYFASPAVWRRR